tara:strand:- start:564 stop:1985 length:1422 start_codon:yes stop_codon:yes gene_type:complete
MTINISNRNLIIFLFFVCLLSRVATSIFYIEDIDSLRFALSIHEFNILKLQPHFPGYPIFIALAKFFHFITGSKGITFSIIGGISLFIFIIYALQLFHIQLNSISGLVCTLILFFNPFFWLMSNRYMPDLMGLCVSVASLYFLTISINRFRSLLIGFFLAGILCGIRLSYVPLLGLPIIYHMYKNRNRHFLFFSFSFGCLLWFLPFVWVTGLDSLYTAAFKQTVGHFYDFGGTAITEGVWHHRILSMIRSIWADGLGGFWFGRSWQTLLLTIPMVYFFYHSLFIIQNKNLNQNQLIIAGSIFIYILWVFFFQNIIHKSRHVMPLIGFSIILLNMGINRVREKNSLQGNILAGLLLLGLINVTFVLTSQHQKPNAISSIKDSIIEKKINYPIVSIPLINYYLKTHRIDNELHDIENINDIDPVKLLEKDSLLLIGNFQNRFLDHYVLIYDSTYYHNPYMNRMWSEINVISLKKK